MMVPFNRRELSVEQEEVFTEHIEQCPDCREELEICYIIEYGLEDAEDVAVDDAEAAALIEQFDFKGLVELKINESNRRIDVYKIYSKVMMTFVFVADIFVILSIIWWIMSQL